MAFSTSPRHMSPDIHLGGASPATSSASLQFRTQSAPVGIAPKAIATSKYKDEYGFTLHRLKPSVYATNQGWFEEHLPAL